MSNYHIRVHHPLDASHSILLVSFLNDVSDLWVLTAEGAYYDKTKHRHVRPHYHIWIQFSGSHSTLRERFKKAFPDHKGNKSYSICRQKKEGDNLLSYVLKGDNLIDFKGITREELDHVPDWVDKKTHFRNELKNHLMQWLIDTLCPGTPEGFPQGDPHFHRLFFNEISRYARDKNRWVTKNDYYRLAYELQVIDTNTFTYNTI